MKRLWLGTAALLLLVGGNAHAGTFDVRSCAASAAKDSTAWKTSVQPGEPLAAGDWCASEQVESDGYVDLTAGRWLRSPTSTGGAQLGLAADLSLAAPSGAELRTMSYRRRLQSRDSTWEVRLKANGALLESCVRIEGRYDCPDVQPGGVFSANLAPGTQRLELGVWCVELACPYDAGGLYDFAAVIYSSVVTLEENTAPTVSVPAFEGLTNGWVGAGTPSAALVGSDAFGLRRLELLDGTAVSHSLPNAACVDWSVLPCSDTSVPGLGPGFGANADLTGLTDGNHELRARATDAAGNQTTSAPVAVRVDRTAPNVGISAGSTTTAATTLLTWKPGTPSGSPLTAARLQLCTGAPTPTAICRDEPIPLEGAMTLPLGEPGTVTTAQVSITDEAGNVGRSTLVTHRRVSATSQADPPVSPPPGTTPAPKRATKLALKSPTKLRPRSTVIDVAGTLTRGAASKVTITVKGRPAGRKRNVTYRATAKPSKTGAWKARVKLPRRVSRRHGVLVTVTATPASGFADATVRKRIRG